MASANAGAIFLIPKVNSFILATRSFRKLTIPVHATSWLEPATILIDVYETLLNMETVGYRMSFFIA
jgi:hypothetical protein